MSEPFLGEIRMVGFNFAPRGWAFCQGQLMSISQNTALFSLLGTTFGGNGVNTFALPDYRSRLAVGIGNNPPGLQPIVQGELGGVQSVTLVSTQMPLHTHVATSSVAVPASTADAASDAPTNASYLGKAVDGGGVGAVPDIYTTTAPGAGQTLAPFNATVTVQPAGGSQPFDVLNPYVGTNFIIALEGIFPSRN